MHKSHWKEWLVFTKSERNATIMLFLIIALIILFPFLLPEKKLEIHIDSALQAELDDYKRNNPGNDDAYLTASYRDTSMHDTVKHELFYFDPNTLSEDGFIKLGLPSKTARTLINYRNKGGYFKKPEDIRKIYSLSKADADKLIPYIHIVSVNNKEPASSDYQKPATQPATSQNKKININAATVEDWKAFPGIGDVLANRIVKFRNSVGGFKSVEQVSKTYGLSDSVYQAIKPFLYLGGEQGNEK